MSGAAPTVPRLHRVLEISACVGVLALLTWMAIRIALGVKTAGHVALATLAVLLGYLLADLMSGFVHWMGDTLGDENARWFGPAFAQPFREHHKDPRAIAAHGFVETNGNTCIVALPPLVAAHVWMPEEPGIWFYVSTFVAALSLFGVATNQCHKWAHSLNPPRVAIQLQRWGLILAPVRHDLHHLWPHRTHYCVLSGRMNVVADRLRLFRAAEHIIRRTRPSWLNEEATRPVLVPRDG